MQTWQDLMRLRDSELRDYDLALVNLACMHGLPGTERLEVTAYLDTLGDWAEKVRRHTAAAAPLFQRDPAAFDNSWPFFRAMDLVTVLQRDLGVRYHPGMVGRDDFFADPRNLFLHGVIESRRGTCSSLPPLYVAIGRRLGYPLRLVATKYHLFARWEDPSGERFNLECTSLGLNSYPDEHYLAWPAPASLEEAEAFGFLRSQSPREELATFLGMRGHCCLDNGRYREAADAYAAALEMEPWNRLHAWALRAAVNRCQGHLNAEDASKLASYPRPFLAANAARGGG